LVIMEAEPQSTSASGRFWKRWFAWRPVFVFSSRSGTRRLVWLEYFERRWTEGITSGLGARWVYRRRRFLRRCRFLFFRKSSLCVVHFDNGSSPAGRTHECVEAYN